METEEGIVLIDHKASPRARADWEEIALAYSGQLEAYAVGITRATGKPVIGRWIHFAVTGGLVEVSYSARFRFSWQTVNMRIRVLRYMPDQIGWRTIILSLRHRSACPEQL